MRREKTILEKIQQLERSLAEILDEIKKIKMSGDNYAFSIQITRRAKIDALRWVLGELEDV